MKTFTVSGARRSRRPFTLRGGLDATLARRGSRADAIDAIVRGIPGHRDTGSAASSAIDAIVAGVPDRRARDANVFKFEREGTQWIIYKNGEKYGPPVESEEAAERVVTRLESQANERARDSGSEAVNLYRQLRGSSTHGAAVRAVAQRLGVSIGRVTEALSERGAARDRFSSAVDRIVRDVPSWRACPECDGRGCDDCGGTGRVQVDESFEKLEHSLAHKKGVKDPEALAAWIGRKSGKIKSS